jgi:hypothetical protein
MIPQGPAKIFLIPFIGFLLVVTEIKFLHFLNLFQFALFLFGIEEFDDAVIDKEGGQDHADDPVGPGMDQPLLKNALDPD